MAQDWDIRPRGSVCQDCQASFEDGQEMHSVLVFSSEGYVRNDYCTSCREKHPEDAGCVSLWRGAFRAPPPKAEEALKKETAESLLRRLMEDDDPSSHNVIFILAVMLERKKILIERGVQTREDNALVRIYEHRKSGETFLVVDPKLSLAEIEPVQEQVIALLGGRPGPKNVAEGDDASTETEPVDATANSAEPDPQADGNAQDSPAP